MKPRKYTVFIAIIILTKLAFMGLSIVHGYLLSKGLGGTKLDRQVMFWRARSEFLFKIAMSIVLIYLFNPRVTEIPEIDHEIRFLLYVFGIVLIITSDWSLFVKPPKALHHLQHSLGETTNHH